MCVCVYVSLLAELFGLIGGCFIVDLSGQLSQGKMYMCMCVYNLCMFSMYVYAYIIHIDNLEEYSIHLANA